MRFKFMVWATGVILMTLISSAIVSFINLEFIVIVESEIGRAFWAVMASYLGYKALNLEINGDE